MSSFAWSVVVVVVSLAGCYRPSRISLERETRPSWSLRARERPPFAGKHLSLDEAITRAERSSPHVTAEIAEAYARRAAADGAAVPEDPEVRVGGIRLDEVGRDEARVTTRLRLKPPRPGELGAREAAAEAVARAAALAAREAERDVEATTLRAYYRVVALDHLIAASRRASDLALRRSEWMRNRLRASGTTMWSAAATEVEARRLERATEGWIRERRRRVAALGDLLDVELSADLIVDSVDSGALSRLQLDPGDVLVAAGVTGSPWLARDAAAVDAASAEADVARAERLPWISFVDLGYEFSPDTEDPGGWTFGAGLTLPLFGHRSAVAAGDAEVVARIARLKANADALADRIRMARRAAVDALEALAALRAGPLRASEHAVAEAEKGLESGQLDESDLLAVRLDEASARVDEADAVGRVLEALAELSALTSGRRTILLRSAGASRRRHDDGNQREEVTR